MNSMRAVALPCCVMVALCLLGCGGGGPAADTPELFEAHGTVTLDGKPLKDAQVLFTAENKAPTSGRTDENGHYVIQYNDEVNGAYPGKNVVRINIGLNFDDPDADDEEEEDEMAMKNLPAKYNSMTALEVDVKEGGAPYDFKLTSK